MFHSFNFRHGSSAPRYGAVCRLWPWSSRQWLLYIKLKFEINVREQRAWFKSSLLSLLQNLCTVSNKSLDLSGLQGYLGVCVYWVHCIAQLPNPVEATVKSWHSGNVQCSGFLPWPNFSYRTIKTFDLPQTDTNRWLNNPIQVQLGEPMGLLELFMEAWGVSNVSMNDSKTPHHQVVPTPAQSSTSYVL